MRSGCGPHLKVDIYPDPPKDPRKMDPSQQSSRFPNVVYYGVMFGGFQSEDG